MKTANTNLSKIILKQKRALKIIFSLKIKVKHPFSDLGILTIYGLYIFGTIIYCKQKADTILNNACHKYNTRPNI